MSEPRWNADHVQTQLRLRLVQEGGTARLLQFLSDDAFSEAFRETLERCAILPTEEAALQSVQQWLQQQQHQRHFTQDNQPLPAVRMWNFVKSLLQSSGTGTPNTPVTRTGSQGAYRTPLPRAAKAVQTPLPSNVARGKRPLPQTPLPRTAGSTPQPRPSRPSPQTPRPAKRGQQARPAHPRTPLSSNVPQSPPQRSTKRRRPPAPSTRHNIPQIREVSTPSQKTGSTAVHSRINRPPPSVPVPAESQVQTPLPNSRDYPTETPLPEASSVPGAAPAPELRTPPGMPSLRDGKIRERRPRLRKKSQSSSTRGLPSSTSLTALPAVGAETPENPQWDVNPLLHQLRLRLLKDKTAGPLRNAFSDSTFQQHLFNTLQTGAALPTAAAAKEYVRSWLLQQQHVHQSFPGQRFWSYLGPVLDAGIKAQKAQATGQEASLPQEAATPAPDRRPRSRPVLPHHKRSLRRRRSSTTLPAVPHDQPSATEAPAKETEQPTTAQQTTAQQTPSAQAARTNETASPQTKPAAKSSGQAKQKPKQFQQTPPAQVVDDTASQLDRMIQNMQVVTQTDDAELQAILDSNPIEHPSTLGAINVEEDLAEAERQRTKRLIVLFGIFLMAIGLFWYTNREPGPDLTGKPLDIKPYAVHLPISKAFGKKKRITFVLQPKWQDKTTPDKLAQKIFRIRAKLRAKNFSRIYVYTPSGKLLYSINLAVRF